MGWNVFTYIPNCTTASTVRQAIDFTFATTSFLFFSTYSLLVLFQNFIWYHTKSPIIHRYFTFQGQISLSTASTHDCCRRWRRNDGRLARFAARAGQASSHCQSMHKTALPSVHGSGCLLSRQKRPGFL